MASVQAIVGAIVSFAIGLVTLRHMSPLASAFLAPFKEECKQTIIDHPITGVKPIDALLCILVPYFEASLEHPTADLVYGYLISAFFVCSVLWYAEASRKGANFLLKLLPVWMLLVQIAGICVIMPAVWISIFLLVNAGDTSSKAALDKKAVPVVRSVANIAIQFLTFTSPISMLFFEGKALTTAIVVFQFVPIFAPLLMLPLRGSTKDRGAGHVAVQVAYILAAGACFLWQTIALVIVAKDPSLPGKLLDLFFSHPGRSVTTYLLLLDGAVTWLALLYFALVEDGVKAFLATTLGSVFLGPGATSVYLAYREQRIIDAGKKLA